MRAFSFFSSSPLISFCAISFSFETINLLLLFFLFMFFFCFHLYLSLAFRTHHHAAAYAVVEREREREKEQCGCNVLDSIILIWKFTAPLNIHCFRFSFSIAAVCGRVENDNPYICGEWCWSQHVDNFFILCVRFYFRHKSFKINLIKKNYRKLF